MDNYKPYIFGFICGTIMMAAIITAIIAKDWSGPILSEMNPNGSVDEWFLFDGAYEAYR